MMLKSGLRNRLRNLKKALSLLIAVTLLTTLCYFDGGGIFTTKTQAAALSSSYWIGVTDQNTHKILVLDPEVTDWNSSSAVQWSWYPNADNGFSASTPGWRLPNDVKLRNSPFYGEQVFTVTDSDGFCAIIPYPAGNTKKWSINLGTGINPVSAELLPDGNIAIAATAAGWVRIYTASQGASSAGNCSVALAGANGVLWDPAKKILWAVGSGYLTGYTVGGTAVSPTLTEDASLRINLPTTGGTDIQHVLGNNDRLWVSTGSGVYQYVKSTKSWDTGYAGSSSINRSGVRSIGSYPAGQPVIEAAADGYYSSWTTRTVDIYRPGGTPSHETRTRSSMATYRARVWQADYCGAASTDSWIAVTDQNTDQILLMDSEVTDWNSSSAVQWSWYPNADNGFSASTPGWGDPSDVKLRNSAFHGGQMMTVTASSGLCAIIPYPGGNTKKWSIHLGSGINPVSADLLPDGNIAIAAAAAGWIRIYTASQGISSTNNCSVALAGANGVLWDPNNQILWAVGSSYITGYTVGGTAASPTLTENTGLRSNLPTADAKELQPVNGDPGRLWVTTASGVYQYTKSTKTWSTSYSGSGSINVAGARSIGNQPDGQTVVETVQDGYFTAWTTRTVRLFRPNGAPSSETRFRSTMGAYRARVWNGDYYGSTVSAAGDCPIAVTDQYNKKVVVFDPAQTEWNKSSAVLWQWFPNASNGFASTDGWTYPSDVKLRNSTFYGGQVMGVCASYGFAAITSYPSGTRLWSANVGGPDNPHAVEILPDGNIAVAASTGGWIRVYTASQGANSINYVQFNLPGAHGTLWDPTNSVLWVLGDDYLKALQITGTAAAPVITEDTSRRLTLPTQYGHDLQPVYGNTDRLWVTTHTAVYQYIKSTKQLVSTFTGADVVNAGAVKSIGNQPDGQTMIRTRPNNTFQSWNTNNVDFFRPGGTPSYEARSHITGAYYKARIWNQNYQ